MKIRQGFVSNSSSSSFMLIGKLFNINDINESDLKDRTFIVIGKELGDGDDIFYVETVEIIWFLKTAYKLDYQTEYFDGFQLFETFKSERVEEGESTFNSANLPTDTEINVLSLWMDYNSSLNVEDLFNKYIYENYDNKEKFKSTYKKLQRKEKLKKIEQNT